MGQAWTEFVFPWIVTGVILHVQVQFSCTCAKSCPFSRNTVKSCYCMDRWASHGLTERALLQPVYVPVYVPREHAARAGCKRSHTRCRRFGLISQRGSSKFGRSDRATPAPFAAHSTGSTSARNK